MNIKLILLRNGETIVSDVEEIINDGITNGYVLKEPSGIFVEPSDEGTVEVMGQNNQKQKIAIRLFQWMPLSKNRNIPVVEDWIVSMNDPVDNIKNTYIQSFKQ